MSLNSKPAEKTRMLKSEEKSLSSINCFFILWTRGARGHALFTQKAFRFNDINSLFVLC